MAKFNTFAVLEIGTSALLYFAPTKLNANLVSAGTLNTLAVQYSTAVKWRENLFKGYDLSKDHLRVYKDGNNVLVKHLDPAVITPEFLAKKQLVTMRGEYLYALEMYTMAPIIRTADLLDPSVLPFITDQLGKAKPEEGYYPNAIQEYAFISGIETDTAYQELSMRVETVGLIRLRAQAIFDKYARMINIATTKAECSLALNKAHEERYMNALV